MQKKAFGLRVSTDKNFQQPKNKADRGSLPKLTANIMYECNEIMMTPLNTPIKHYAGSLMQCNKP